MSGNPAAAVLDELIARCSSAPTLDGVGVYDGPPIGGVTAADVLALGTQIPTVAAVTARQDLSWSGDAEIEFDVVGVIECHSGNPADLAARRRRAYEVLDAVDDLVAADRTIGGTCDDARLARSAYRVVRSAEGEAAGVRALIDFAVRVSAYRDPTDLDEGDDEP